MLNIGIKFVMEGHEVSMSSLIEAVVREIRTSVREEIGRTPIGQPTQNPEPPAKANSGIPVHAVSIPEAARMLNISTATIRKYVSLRAIPNIRIGRRVLIPMTAMNDIFARGIPRRKQ